MIEREQLQRSSNVGHTSGTIRPNALQSPCGQESDHQVSGNTTRATGVVGTEQQSCAGDQDTIHGKIREVGQKTRQGSGNGKDDSTVHTGDDVNPSKDHKGGRFGVGNSSCKRNQGVPRGRTDWSAPKSTLHPPVTCAHLETRMPTTPIASSPPR